MRPHFIPAYSVCHPSTSVDDVADVEAASQQCGGSDHDEHRDLVGDHQLRGPHSSDEGVLVVLCPSRNQDEERGQGEERHDDEQSGVVVDDEPPSGQGDHARHEDGHSDNQGHGPHVGHPVDLSGDGVLLHEGLQTVGDALKESLHSDHRSPSVHHPTEALTLHPQRYQRADEDHDEDDQHEDDQREERTGSVAHEPLGNGVPGEDQVDEPGDGSADDLPQAVGDGVGQVVLIQERIVLVVHQRVAVEPDEIQDACVFHYHAHHLSVSPRHMSIWARMAGTSAILHPWHMTLDVDTFVKIGLRTLSL